MSDFFVEVVPTDSKDTIVLRPNGSIDSTSTPSLETQFNSAMEDSRFCIVVDLAKTDFISSAGLGLILGTVSTLRAQGGDLILMNIPDSIADVFDTMSVSDYFRTITSLDEIVTVDK